MTSSFRGRRAAHGRRFLAAFALVVLSSCETAPPDAGQPVLRVVQSSVSMGDPHIASDSSDRLGILFSVYEALVKRSPRGDYHPSLAVGWGVSDDARTWTFTLRQGVQFHNGEVLKASDVVATLGRVLDPAIGGAFGTQGVYISYLGTAEITALDESTVRIVTAEPMADLLDLLVAMPIAPASALADLPGRYVGSGPYEVAELSDDRVVLGANDGYWGEPPRYSEIHWLAEPDADRRVQAVLSGGVDIASGIGVRGSRRIAEDGRARVQEWDSGLAIIFMANAQAGPLRDRRVRQALNYALDQDEIIAEVMEGGAKPLTGYLTPHHFGYDPETPAYPYDPNRARALLAEAGHGDGLSLTFDIPSVMPDEAPRLARLMAEQYSRVGISVDIVEHEDRAAYSEMVRAKQIHDAAAFDSSPRSTFRVLREKIHSGLRGPWWEGYVNEEVDSLIAEAQATLAEADRRAIYRRIYRIIRADAPWIFLYRPTRYWGVGPALEGWEPRADGLLIFS